MRLRNQTNHLRPSVYDQTSKTTISRWNSGANKFFGVLRKLGHQAQHQVCSVYVQESVTSFHSNYFVVSNSSVIHSNRKWLIADRFLFVPYTVVSNSSKAREVGPWRNSSISILEKMYSRRKTTVAEEGGGLCPCVQRLLPSDVKTHDRYGKILKFILESFTVHDKTHEQIVTF